MGVQPRVDTDGRTVERRAPEPLVYRPEQLLGRRPIRLRRRSDKIRLAAHLAAVAVLVGLSIWWVVPLHAFAGPVLLTLTATHGVHVGDLPVLLFLAVAARSMMAVQHLVTAR
jgi:hypothetical protein